MTYTTTFLIDGDVDELFFSNQDHWQRFSPLQTSLLAVSGIWTRTECRFRLFQMKLCSSDNHYTMTPWHHMSIVFILKDTNRPSVSCFVCKSMIYQCKTLLCTIDLIFISLGVHVFHQRHHFLSCIYAYLQINLSLH